VQEKLLAANNDGGRRRYFIPLDISLDPSYLQKISHHLQVHLQGEFLSSWRWRGKKAMFMHILILEGYNI